MIEFSGPRHISSPSSVGGVTLDSGTTNSQASQLLGPTAHAVPSSTVPMSATTPHLKEKGNCGWDSTWDLVLSLHVPDPISARCHFSHPLIQWAKAQGFLKGNSPLPTQATRGPPINNSIARQSHQSHLVISNYIPHDIIYCCIYIQLFTIQ